LEHKVLFFVELAAGIVLGFMAWSYISPMLTTIAPTPSA
jgi:hypothetical protein